MKIRAPYVAGSFYPGNKKALLDFFSSSLRSANEPLSVRALYVPHAGYVYSGLTAAKTFSQVRIPNTAVILGPNHTGRGRLYSIMPAGVWETPLGRVPIDEPLSEALLRGPRLESDEEAHRSEHAIEVQLPFLQYLCPNIRFVPITVGGLELSALREIGLHLAKVILEYPEPVLILASGDMNHYENQAITLKKDQKAIDAMLALDEMKLADVVDKEDISMCGFAPAFVAMIAAKALGTKEVHLIDHATSAAASGDFERVVGYAGLAFL